MAAYAALTSLAEITDLLHNIIVQKSDGVARSELLQQLKKNCKSISESTYALRSFLEKSSPTNQFEAQIKDAADQAEGIIGRFVSEQLSSNLAVDDVTLKGLCHRLQRVHEGTMISSMVEKINNNSVCEMVSDQESIGILEPSSASRPIPLSRHQVIIGVEDVFNELGRLVFGVPSTQLRVVSIVGMGGLGKTTLARKFYNHTTISKLFEIRGWVTVSQDFSARDILVSLMASIQPYVRYPKERTESIENHVRKNLKGRRFLIILDDVWSREVLHFLMRTFPDDGNSSRILLTTRQKEVAVDFNPTTPMMHIITMRFLTRQESYELLLYKVFQKERCPPELKMLLESISMKCEGLPLAIVLVAGILSTINRSLREWGYIFKRITSANKSGHEIVDFILSLGYTHLPHRLRSCLLYLGVFPEDHEINVSRLAKQLLAQDFLQKPSVVSSSSGSSEVEQCLQDLVRRNLASVLKMKLDNGIKSIGLHDMVRDFCLKKAQQEKFLHCVTDDNFADRDLTGTKIKVMFSSDILKRSCISGDADETRTIMCFGRGRTQSPLTSIGRFELLKSLDLVNVEIESFPIEVLQLFLLRLLALCHVPELPRSISNLQYLETLVINPRDCSSGPMTSNLPCMLCMPFELWTMQRLKHVVSFCCGPLPSPKQENSPLRNLETLSAVMNLDCSNELMEMIPNIKKLGIFYFGVGCATHSIRNIERLHNLEKLKLWVLVPFSSPQNLDLGFPRTLRKLTLGGIRLSHQDMHIIGRLPYLQVLKLRHNNFERDEWRIARFEFRELKYLLLEELGMRNWLSNRGNGFILPVLQTLVIRTCNKLRKIADVVNNIPSLELIEVVGCKNKLLVEYVRRIKQFYVHQNPNLEVLVKN